MHETNSLWAVVATADTAILADVATRAWSAEVTAGGSAPPWRTLTVGSESVLAGDEPGLQGCFDLWAKAISAELDGTVLVIDCDPEFLQVFEGRSGAVKELPDTSALDLARRYGLLKATDQNLRPPESRDMLVIENADEQALLAALELEKLPPALRTREVNAGLAVWTVAERGKVTVFLYEASFVGRTYSLMWGPPPRRFACSVMENGKDIGWFDADAPGPKGVAQLDNIRGASLPEEICRALGVQDIAASLV